MFVAHITQPSEFVWEMLCMFYLDTTFPIKAYGSGANPFPLKELPKNIRKMVENPAYIVSVNLHFASGSGVFYVLSTARHIGFFRRMKCQKALC